MIFCFLKIAGLLARIINEIKKWNQGEESPASQIFRASLIDRTGGHLYFLGPILESFFDHSNWLE